VSVMTTDTKEDIRESMRGRQKALAEDWVHETSLVVIARVARLNKFEHARVVGTYLALPYEVQTMPLVKICRDRAKKVCIPAWDETAEQYRMAWLNADTETISGPMNIPQPRDPVWVDLEDIEFMAVPGVAFDPRGGRLGHGGGHFDRLLSRFGGFKAALAFEFQIVEKIPLGAHDVPVDVVITERMNYPDEGT